MKLAKYFLGLIAAVSFATVASAQSVPAPNYLSPLNRLTPTVGVVCINPDTKNPESCAGAGGGGGGSGASVTATAAAPTYVEGSTTAPLSSNLSGDLRTISKIASGQVVGITGALPAGANTIGVVNLGTLNGAATAANQTAVQGTFGAVTATRMVIYDSAGSPVSWADPVPLIGTDGSSIATPANPVPVGGTALTSLVNTTTTSDGRLASIDTKSGETHGTTGAAVPAKATLVGANSGGNLAGIIQGDSSVPISTAAAATSQLVALSSGKKIYVTAWDVIASGTTAVKLVYGTGTNCGTGTTDVTGNYSLTAQTGLAKGSGLGPVLVIPASQALCVVNSTAIQVSGSLTFTQF
jgi:hypothetical protein